MACLLTMAAPDTVFDGKFWWTVIRPALGVSIFMIFSLELVRFQNKTLLVPYLESESS